MSTQPPAGQKKPAPIVAIKQYVEARAMNLQNALKGTGVNLDRFLTLALNQTLQNPKLLDCTPASWFDALQKSATHGLLPDGIHGALVPYKQAVTFQPMYQGLVQRAYATKMVGKIWAKVVYADDEFEVVEGDNPRIIHRPAPTGDRSDANLVAVYACAKVGVEVMFEVLYPRDVKTHENASKSASNSDSPWKTNRPAMWKKTAIIVLSKTLPHTPDSKFAELVNDGERADLGLDVIDVSLVPEGPSGLNPLKEQLRAMAEAGPSVPTPVQHSGKPVDAPAFAIGAQPGEGTHPADAADAEKEPAVVVPPGKRKDGSVCMHEALRGARLGTSKKFIACPEMGCDAELTQAQCDALGPV